MTIHQCPKCELRFSWPTELDDHCRNDHPEFHHDYPATPAPREAAAAVARSAPPSESDRTSAILATWWTER